MPAARRVVEMDRGKTNQLRGKIDLLVWDVKSARHCLQVSPGYLPTYLPTKSMRKNPLNKQRIILSFLVMTFFFVLFFVGGGSPTVFSRAGGLFQLLRTPTRTRIEAQHIGSLFGRWKPERGGRPFTFPLWKMFFIV